MHVLEQLFPYLDIKLLSYDEVDAKFYGHLQVLKSF